MTYSSDNAKRMVGKKNSLLTKIKNAQQCGKSISGVGCPYHLAHLCVEKGAEELSLNIKDMIRSYIIISIEVSRENLHSVYIIKHVSTCWLSLGKCLERMLTELDALKSYFVSNFDLNDDAYDNEENYNTKSKEER